MKHMKINHLFSSRQFGFIKGRSTVLQLMKIIDDWSYALDNNKQVDAIYFDIMKAFDTVPHQRLLGKLESYGLSVEIVSWIKNFLTNRVQRVSVNGSDSKWQNVMSGIPQGSILGPVLFIIYMNDLPENITSEIYLFADDTKIYCVIETINDQRILQSDIRKLEDWSRKWLLKFHPGKCKQLTIGNKPDKRYPGITVTVTRNYYMKQSQQSKAINSVSEEKDIGVTFDSKLSFDQHIAAKVKKANSMVGTIRRSYQFLDNKSFIILYKTLVRCHFDYATSIWSPYLVRHRDIIEGVW